MHSLRELEAIINRHIHDRDLSEFHEFIEREIKKDERFLNRYFLINGKNFTVLNYLIQLHNQKIGRDTGAYICDLIERKVDFNNDSSLHLALSQRKFDLFKLLVQGETKSKGKNIDFIDFVAVNSRDTQGQTLLAWAIQQKHTESLLTLLEHPLIDIDTPSGTEGRRSIQPLHLAVFHDYPEGIYHLLRKGAVLDSSHGIWADTPFLRAARLGKIEALKTLLDCASAQLNVNAENEDNQSAIKLLAKRLASKVEPQQAIRGIAMLLCHGASVPNKEISELLMEHRFALLNEVKNYTANSPKLAHKFVRACHDKTNLLHEAIYATNSWIQSIRRFFLLPCREAFLVEALIYDGSIEKIHTEDGFAPLKTISTREGLIELETQESAIQDEEDVQNRDEKKFAEFVWRYDLGYKNPEKTFFSNPWSKMKSMLEGGSCTSMDDVCKHSKEGNRTHDILSLMDGDIPPAHDNLYEPARL